MSSLLKYIFPDSGLYIPVITLKRVDLPDPLVPISPTISFSLTWRETLLTAVTPPNLIVTSLTSSIIHSLTPISEATEGIY